MKLQISLASLVVLFSTPSRVEAVRLFEDRFETQQQLGAPDVGLTWQSGNNTPLPLVQNGQLIMDASGGDQVPLVAQRLPIPSASSQRALRIEFELSPDTQSAGVGVGGFRLDSGANQYLLPGFGNPVDRIATNSYLTGAVVGGQRLLIDSQFPLPTSNSHIIRSTIRSLPNGSGVEFDIDLEPVPQQGFVDLATFVRPYVELGGTGAEFPGGFDQFNLLSLLAEETSRYLLDSLRLVSLVEVENAVPELVPRFRWIERNEESPTAVWSNSGNWSQLLGGTSWPAITAPTNSPHEYDVLVDFDGSPSPPVRLDRDSFGNEFYVRRVDLARPGREGFEIISDTGSEALKLGPSLSSEAPSGLSVSNGNHEIQQIKLQNDTVDLIDPFVFDIASGSLTVEVLNLNDFQLMKTNDGALFITGTLPDTGGAIIAEAGTIGGNGTIGGDLHNHAAIVAPGLATGKLTVDGNYLQEEEGTLQIDIAGSASSGLYDQLTVAGTANLAGMLDVSLEGSPSLTIGDRFTVLTSAGIAGDASLSLTGAAASSFTLDVVGNNVVLEFAGSEVDVDLDDDGDVDGRDFLLIQRSNPSLIPYWQAAYGSSAGASAPVVAIPETATLQLVALGLLGLLPSMRSQK